MESKHSDQENLTSDDSRETETAVSETERQDEKPTPEPTVQEGEPDFDVRPADTYLGPDYDPKKSAGPKALWLGVLMVAMIIGLTYYAFRGQPVSDQGYEVTAGDKAAAVRPEPNPNQQLPSLPEKAPDAADFSPTPETEVAAVAPTSLPATASSSTPPTPAREPAVTATTSATDTAKADSAKNNDSSRKAKKDDPKSGTTKSSPTTGKPTETKPTTTIGKPTETKPATTTGKTAETKPATEASQSAAAVAVPTEPKADQGKPEAPKSSETAPAATTATASATEAKPAATGSTPASAGEISDLWVVNISSTPDAAESNRLLNRVIATDVGGQVYFYETNIDGRVHHRIRVGFFNSRGEAEAVGQKVKEVFKLSATPWAVKPTVEEVERYQKK